MQLSYSHTIPTAVNGLPSEDWLKYIDTVIPGTAVKVGRFLVADTTSGQVRNKAMLPSAAVQITGPRAMGITILDSTREGGSDYPALRPTPVMRKGRIWVVTEDAITRFVYPFVRYTVNGGNDIGGFRSNADTNKAVECRSMITLTDADAGGLVLVEIDLMGGTTGATGATGPEGPTGPTGT